MFFAVSATEWIARKASAPPSLQRLSSSRLCVLQPSGCHLRELILHKTLRHSEVWSNSTESKRFSLLKKGQLVVVSGYIKPENYIDRQGVEQSRITFVCTSVSIPNVNASDKTAAKSGATAQIAPAVEAEVVPF